jgi:hypothetical protein
MSTSKPHLKGLESSSTISERNFHATVLYLFGSYKGHLKLPNNHFAHVSVILYQYVMQSLFSITSYFPVAAHQGALQFGFVSTFSQPFSFFVVLIISNSLVIHILVVIIWLPADFLSSLASSHILHQREGMVKLNL